MKTKLPTKLTTLFDVALLIKNLGENEELYHPEDSAHDIVDEKGNFLFTTDEAILLDELMSDAFELCDVCEVSIRWLHSNGNEFFANYYDENEPTFNQKYGFTKN